MSVLFMADPSFGLMKSSDSYPSTFNGNVHVLGNIHNVGLNTSISEQTPLSYMAAATKFSSPKIVLHCIAPLFHRCLVLEQRKWLEIMSKETPSQPLGSFLLV